MLNYSVVKAAPEHILHLAANMRAVDRREVWAAHRQTPFEALALSLERSERAWTVIIDGQPAAMWGVARDKGLIRRHCGIPWLLAAGALERREVRREFIRRSRGYVALMQEGFHRLENYVHAANLISIRWLRWCGFNVGEDAVMFNGEKFLLFWRETNV